MIRSCKKHLSRLGSSTPPLPPDTFPVYAAAQATSVDFIVYFNWLLGRATIDPYDQPLIDSFLAIGIGPNLPFDFPDKGISGTPPRRRVVWE